MYIGKEKYSITVSIGENLSNSVAIECEVLYKVRNKFPA